MDETRRHRLDDLRRHATALGSAAGLARNRAADLAGHLLWYDAAGVPACGIRGLPDWLERIDRGEVDRQAQGQIGPEHPGTAVVDGGNGLPPLVLARAAAVAAEKARDVGVGVVRVGNLQPLASAAEVSASVAIGPLVATIVGPGPSWTLALPSAAGLPVVLDTGLDALARGAEADGGQRSHRPVRPAWTDLVGPWADALVPDGGWLIVALAVPALESLVSFQERVSATLAAAVVESPGALLPVRWEAHRREARERGVPLDPQTLATLRRHAERLGVEPLA